MRRYLYPWVGLWFFANLLTLKLYPVISKAGDEAWLAAQGLYYLKIWAPVEAFFVGGLGQGGHGLLPYYLHVFLLGLAQMALPDPLLAARLTSLLAGALAIALTYEAFGGREGLGAAAFLSLEPTFFLASRHARPEVWLLAFALAIFVVLKESSRTRAFFAGLLGFLSVGFHPSGIALLLASFVFSKRKFPWVALGALAGLLGVYGPMVGPWLLKSKAFFPVNPAQAHYAKPLLVRIVLDPLRQPFRAPLDMAAQVVGGVRQFGLMPYSLVLAFPFLYKVPRRALWFFLAAAATLLLVSSSTWRGPQAYLLLLPAAGAGLFSLREKALVYPTFLLLAFLGMDANLVFKAKGRSLQDIRAIGQIERTVPLSDTLGAWGWIAAYWGHPNPEAFLVPWEDEDAPEVLERARFLVVGQGKISEFQKLNSGEFRLLWEGEGVSLWRK